MGDRNEPPRHVDMQKWSNTWDRIRARQAEERAAAAASELREEATAPQEKSSLDSTTPVE